MRRTARVLSVVALTGAALTGAVPLVAAEPAAEVSPAAVSPGGSITVSVSCDPVGGSPPATMDATSEAFEEGTVALHLVPGNDDELSGPAYRGTARIAPAEALESEPAGLGPDTAWTVEGTCPAAPGGQGAPWSATFTVTKDGGGATSAPPCPESSHGTACPAPCPEPSHQSSHGSACPAPCPEPSHQSSHGSACPPPAPVQHGVRAGEGGTFTDSVPALVAGGLLITGALGGAAYRLHRRNPAKDA
ncbi:hypothetical protein [Streptomyces sp. NPDC053367]|uniref:hypothetical protein n=1 Tax=Streptomyces sp. NPDC053367 TaxID=3365700 RepID=UPI0037CECDBA